MFKVTRRYACGCLPPRDPEGHKGTFGKVLIAGGRKKGSVESF